MDRFIIRQSPAPSAFSSHKVPTYNGTSNASTSSPATIARAKLGGAVGASAAAAAAAAGSSTRPKTPVPTVGRVAVAPASPSVRDLQLMRIFQSDAAHSARPQSPLATLNNSPNSVAGDDVFTFTGRKDNKALPTRMASSDEQENRPAVVTSRVKMSHHTKLAAAVSVQSPRIAATTSASATIRAIQAAQQRTEPIAYFDVPAAEQDIRTTEELAAAQRPLPTIREVMRDVRVYVEVRSGADNRSQGIKTVIADLGAAVNDRLLRNTTHVVFKDGLLSTYQRAKAWGIPVVSILWIEACRRQVCLLDPARFVISNVDRYEQPELHDKIRKQKSMQPYAEETRRRNVPTAKTATAKTGAAGTAASGTAAVAAPPAAAGRISVPRKPKDNLPSIFGDFVKTLQQNGTDGLLNKNSKLMEIIRNSPLPVGGPSSSGAPEATSLARRTLFRSASSNDSIASTPTMLLSSDASASNALEVADTPTRRVTRRNSMQNLSAVSMDQGTPSMRSGRGQTSIFAAVREEVDDTTEDADTEHVDMELTSHNAGGAKSARKTTHSRRKTMVPSVPTAGEVSVECNGDAMSTPKTVERKKAPLLNSVLRRQTLYTPQPMQETICGGDSQPVSASRASSARRRTMFTPSQDAESTARRLERLMSDEGSSSTASSLHIDETAADLTPSPPININSTLVDELSLAATPSTPVFGVAAATILAEYSRTVAQTPTFSSTRTPTSNRRRTMFDMSMEIIEQRLQNINRMAAAASARKLHNRSMSESDAAADEESAGQTASMQSSESCDGVSMQQARSLGPIAEADLGKTTAATAATDAPTPADKPKKRKLYAPSALSNFGDDGDETVAPTALTLTDQPKTTGETTKRRRENADDGGNVGDIVGTATTNKRAKITPASSAVTKEAVATAKTTKSKAAIRTKASSQLAANRRRTTLDFTRAIPTAAVKRPLGTVPAAAVDGPVAATQPQQMAGVIVSTNMHQEQIKHIKETVLQLGAFQLEPNVTARSTHLVSLEPLRTVNFLRGLIRGLWILRYDWIVQSAAAGRWLPEEPFEVRDFSAAVPICRSERQSFGARYHINIFADLSPMYIVAANCACPNLRELVLACDGHVTDDMERAKYVISDTAVAMPVRRISGQQPTTTTKAVCVKSTWILDSISIAKVKKVHAYLVA